MKTKALLQQTASLPVAYGDALERSPLAGYRKYTVGMVHRYFRISLETGKLPSLLGSQFFRTRVTSYRMSSFEDAVIFVRDVERCLEALDPSSQQMIAHCILEGFRQEEVARRLNCPLRTVKRKLAKAVDDLTRLFLDRKILRPFACQ